LSRKGGQGCVAVAIVMAVRIEATLMVTVDLEQALCG
jgi:hypothetical protein